MEIQVSRMASPLPLSGAAANEISYVPAEQLVSTVIPTPLPKSPASEGVFTIKAVFPTPTVSLA